MNKTERHDSTAERPDEPQNGEAGKSVEQELVEYRDKFLRAQAEIANVTRRLSDERAQAIRNANASFARDLLTVVDNFERMFATLKDRPESDPVAHGARLVYDMLMKVLKNHGVEPIETIGQPFDPRFHEALIHQPSPTVPEGHIVSEMVKGYRMNDRVLRAAVVAVARRPDEGGA